MSAPGNGNGTSVTKRTRSQSSRRRKPKASASVTREVSPEAIERFARTLVDFLCAVGHPDHGETLTEADRPSRDQLGSLYIAAIAEQRPDVAGHGYPGGQPDWDDIGRLYLNRLDPFSARSIVLPDWMALPLIRRSLIDPELRKAFGMDAKDPDETDSDKVDPT